MDDSKISKLSFFGALFTLIVISLGAWVRLTDAGLGCPDWPGCYGLLTTPDTVDELAKAREYYPNADIDVGKAWREMLHRYMAGLLGLYVFFITYISIKYSKRSYTLPVLISILIIIQAIMGMLTVTMLVKPTIVTTHLFFGMLTATLLFMNSLKYSNISMSSEKIPAIALIVISITWVFLIIQILLGGWTSTNYASLACTDFPKCLDQWYPKEMIFNEAFNVINLPDVNYEGGILAYGAKVAIHYSHRITALILTFVFISALYVVFKLNKHSLLKKLMSISIIFFILQIILGISNVVYSLPLNIAVWHTMNAAILMALISSALYYCLLSFYKTR
ncbi:COX15/CtaA family protein [Gammaproteobacteria bacterium]|nr:COX15/CtaA family protein [Gammaproteobacteria bacterium]MDC0985166.1 COX15/CtaA family protein [Gammaproteobacteria bacterium]